MSEIDELMKVFVEAGRGKGILANKEIAHLVASGHKVLSTSAVSQKFYARFWQFNISINQSNHIHKIRISKTEMRNKSD